VARTALGNTHADQFFGQIEAGWRAPLAGTGAALLPFAQLQGSTNTQAGFGESGADSLNLTVAAQTTNSLRTVLGTQLQALWGNVDVRLRAGWSHEYADTARPVTASFAGAPALPFTTQGPSTPRDGAAFGAGIDAPLADATRLYARYDGELLGGNASHLFTAGLRIVW
jgi:outer membrane autotransporter protein